MSILIFWLNLVTILCILVNLLHLSIKHSILHLSFSIILPLAWSFYLYFSSLPLPDTFIITVVILLLLNGKWYFKLCYSFVSILALNIISNILLFSYCIITGIDISNHEIYYSYSDLVVFVSIIVISFLLKHKISKYAPLFYKIPVRGYVLILVVTIIDFFLSSVSSLLFYANLNALGRRCVIIAIFLMIFLSILLLLAYFKLQHYNQLLKETNLVNEQMLRLEEQHYKMLQKKNDDLRSFKHDYNYHITAMQGLIAAGKSEELYNYIQNLSDVKEQVYYFSTNHPVADAIVNYFYETISRTVSFQVEGKLPQTLFVSDSDLCIILSNLLHNAVEAIEKLEKNAKPEIYISLYANEEYISIIVENTCEEYDKQHFDSLPTSKKDSMNHGWGLKNVRDTVQKYYGTLDLKFENNLFTATVRLHNINESLTTNDKEKSNL